MSDPNVVVARNTDKAPVSDLYSQTVAFSHYNNLSAQLPIDPATGAIVAGGAAEQAEQCFKNIQAVVESIGHDMNDIIRVSIFLADIMDLNAVEKVQASFFPTYQPARTVVAVDALPQGALVFIEALVDNGEGTQSVPQAGDLVKLTNNTHAAPYDAGSTQTVAFSHYNNITMQLPLDPGTGRPILGDVAAQTAQCLRNVKAILTSVDVPFDDIVKVTIFVKNLADASVVDEVYKTFFPDSGIARAVNYLPARTVVPVKDLPYHCDVAVEAVVSHGDGTPPQAIEDRHRGVQHRRRPEVPACHPVRGLLALQQHLRPAAARSVRQAHRRHRRRADRPVPRLREGHHRVGGSRGGGHREGERVSGRHRRPRRHE